MMNILFFEDDELMSEMYPLILKEPDYNTEVFQDIKAGIARVLEWHPDVVLLDMMMPVMNGLEVLDILKGNTATASIPVIMLSNLLDDTFISQAKEKGAAGYCIKSDFSGAGIKGKIREILAGISKPLI